MAEFVALSLQGGREKVNGQRFKELTSGWDTKPNSLTLSNKSFDCEAAEALVEYLNTIDGDALTVLDMGDVIASRPEDEALAALRIMSSGFKRFKLVNVNVSDNAFGAKGIDACKDVLEHMPLKVSVAQTEVILPN
jgi:Ran GTPase-activating protein (RanGAP) involved in mRNA processing and transport